MIFSKNILSSCQRLYLSESGELLLLLFRMVKVLKMVKLLLVEQHLVRRSQGSGQVALWKMLGHVELQGFFWIFAILLLPHNATTKVT
jgi:hypothetical protein